MCPGCSNFLIFFSIYIVFQNNDKYCPFKFDLYAAVDRRIFISKLFDSDAQLRIFGYTNSFLKSHVTSK